jgi:cellulose synthase/poly-beta-1,6-N-acetylglucosamine synthase-like glycosyltransferase
MPRTSHKKEVVISCLSLALTIACFITSVLFILDWTATTPTSEKGIGFHIYNGLFLTLITAFAYGNFLYQVTRIGYYLRLGEHTANSDPQAPMRFAAHSPQMPTLSVLIPSYKEELVTVQQTLLSAVFMGYRDKVVSLLLDDPDSAPGTKDHIQTQKTVDMVHALEGAIGRARRHYGSLYQSAEQRMQVSFQPVNEIERLAEAKLALAKWMQHMGDTYRRNDHIDKLFVRKVFSEPAELYRRQAEASAAALPDLPDGQLRQYILDEYSYMRDLFATRLTILQRKKFSNLSHEPNKAMNINSYISLMGGQYLIVDGPAGEKQSLEAFDPSEPAARHRADDAELVIPDTDYVITLDADSILDHQYAATLVEIMERPGNERIAVAQTPYNAIPGTDNTLERTAGATTDIQYIIHQGFTKFGATYWVGANALLRKRALDDIAETLPGEPLVRQFVQDRTVIEDTESSIDLINKGWSLYNHPDRMAYSATPNDYGSLLIQRRRWANGGLIIMPKLLNYLLRRPSFKKIPEGFMRIHYLASIAMVNIGLVIMLFVPMENVGFSAWVPLTALPYFFLYYRDLRMLGYDRLEILRVYAINLLLVPINMGGVLKSMQQMVTRNKIPFGRTPKVGSRTAAPALYHAITTGIFLYLVMVVVSDIIDGEYLFAALLAVNALFLGYALVVFVGLRSIAADIRLATRQVLRVRRTSQPQLQPAVEIITSGKSQ